MKTILNKIKQSRLFEKDYIYIILILVIGTILFTWFKGDLVVSGGDYPFNYSPKNSFFNYYSTWSNLVSLGGNNTQAIPHLFDQSLYYLSSLIGFPLWLTQRIIFYLLFITGGISVYLFSSKIVKIENKFCLWAALFYMFNPYSLVYVWGILSVLMFAYAVYPLLLYIFAKGLNGNRLKNIVLFNIVGLTFSMFCGNFSYVLILWLLLLSFLIFKLVTEKENRNKRINFFIIIVISWILTNSYWIFPYFIGLKELARDAVYQDTVDIFVGSTAKASLYNTFRLFGYPVFFEKFMGIDDFYHYAGAYKHPIIIIISFFIPISAFIGIFFMKKEKEKQIYYFFSLLLVSLFIYKGAQPPFGGMLLNLIKNIPLMVSFRNPLDKVGSFMVLSYSFLIAYSLSRMNKLLRKKINFNIFFIIFSITTLGILCFPFWTGKVFDPGGKIRPSLLTKMPEYYFELSDWLLKQEEDFRILAIPINNTFGTPYNWEFGHGGTDLTAFVLPKPLVYLDQKLAEVTYSCLIKEKEPKQISDHGCLVSTLGALNVRYILVHNDVQENYFNVNADQLNSMRNSLKNNYFEGILFEKSFGKIDLYRVSDKYFFSKFYFPENLSFLTGPPDLWKNALFAGVLQPTFIINTQNQYEQNLFIQSYFKDRKHENININLDKETLSVMSIKNNLIKSNIIVEKKRPGYYLLSFSGLREPQLLVFSDNYSNQWKAFQEGIELIHFSVNGFANSWWVTNLELPIEIKYSSQPFFYFGLLISSLSLISLIILYGFNLISNKKNENKKRN